MLPFLRVLLLYVITALDFILSLIILLCVQGTETHVFGIVDSRQAGIKYGDDWNGVLGMRGTQSGENFSSLLWFLIHKLTSHEGSITITDVTVPWTSALGFNKNKEFVPLGAFNTLLLPGIQLTFSNFYLGIAQGALKKAAKYTAKNTRAWPFSGDVKAKGTDEFYVQVCLSSFTLSCVIGIDR